MKGCCLLIRNPILRLLLPVRIDKVSVVVGVICALFVASTTDCLGPQYHSEVATIVGSSGSCRDVRNGGHAFDRGRAPYC